MKTIFQNKDIEVRTNGDVIHIRNKKDTRSEVRIAPDQEGLSLTTSEGRIIPWAINNKPAILIRGGKSIF